MVFHFAWCESVNIIGNVCVCVCQKVVKNEIFDKICWLHFSQFSCCFRRNGAKWPLRDLLESDLEHFGVIFWKLVTECKSEKYDTLPYTFSYNAIDCENVWQISKQERFSMQFRIHFTSQVQLSLSQY